MSPSEFDNLTTIEYKHFVAKLNEYNQNKSEELSELAKSIGPLAMLLRGR